jgi:hypothetical protein
MLGAERSVLRSEDDRRTIVRSEVSEVNVMATAVSRRKIRCKHLITIAKQPLELILSIGNHFCSPTMLS